MTKFAFIRNKTLTPRAFNTRYSVTKLLKQFKCKKLVELSYAKDLSKEDNFTDINGGTLQSLSYDLHHARNEVLPNDHKYLCDPKKLFMFSEDAADTAFILDTISDGVDILLFELNYSEINDLSEAFENISEAIDSLDTLEEVGNLIRQLGDYSNDLGIDILRSDAEDNVLKLEEEADEKKEEASTTIEYALLGGW